MTSSGVCLLRGIVVLHPVRRHASGWTTSVGADHMVSQNSRQLRMQNRASRLTRRSAVRSLASSARQPDVILGSSGKELAVADFHGNAVVLGKPRGLPGNPWRTTKEKFALGALGILLRHPEMIMVENAQRLDHVGDSDPAVADDEEVLAIVHVRRLGEVIGPEVNAG